jgi:hypothetical protein
LEYDEFITLRGVMIVTRVVLHTRRVIREGSHRDIMGVVGLIGASSFELSHIASFVRMREIIHYGKRLFHCNPSHE